MFRTIVVGTDWSDTADVAFAKAVELARLGGASLHVVSAARRRASRRCPCQAAAAYYDRPDFQADRRSTTRSRGSAGPASST